MRRFRVSIVLAVATAVLAGSGPAIADDAPTDPGGQVYVIQVDPGQSDAVAHALADLGATPTDTFGLALDGLAVELTPDQAAQVAAMSDVADVSVEHVFTITDTQPTPSTLWSLDRIDQPALPLNGQYVYQPNGGAGVRVYIVDTGITDHSAFTGRLTSGYTVIGDSGGTTDCNGHGTHVAGTVAATTTGVAKAATLVPIRVMGCDGKGTTTSIISGLDWILANHPVGTPGVVNISLGGPKDDALNAAIERVTNAGLTVATSAGNENTDACNASPASAPSALTVGASTITDARWTSSNWGTCLDVFAPGENVASTSATDPAGYLYMSGTSMASPHVAGVAALYLGTYPYASPAQVAGAIAATAPQAINPSAGSTTHALISTTATSSRPAMTPVQGYIFAVYDKLFHRTPDFGGLRDWTNALNGGVARNAVADAITSSPEYRSRLIAGSYATYLNRTPDAQGLAFWLAQMNAGMTIQQMEAGFISSDEYYARAGGAPTGWVRTLYQDVLKRGAADAEVAGWVDVLARGGSRADVAIGFLLSTEHLSTVVNGVYVELLGRGLDPTGQTGWVTKIQQGVRLEVVIGGIVASDEFWGKNAH